MYNRSFSYEKGCVTEQWQNAARAELKDLLGITDTLSAPRVPLNPVSIWKKDFADGSVEKIRLTMEDGFDNHIYLCLPHHFEKPYKTFICLQGHSTGMHVSIGVDWKDETSPHTDDGDRDFAIGCMKRGIAAICLEQRAMGENSTNEQHYPACLVPAMQLLLYGRTLLGQRIFDVSRVVDFMRERGDFDMSHVGLMGNSGGGTTTMFAAAVLPEITHAMPSCSFSSFKASIGSIHHCSCNFVPGLSNYGESADVLGLIAPRPLVVVNGRFDPIFPLAAAQEQFARLKEIYASLNAEENCQHVIGEGEHRFYAEDAWKIMLPLWND